MRLLLTRSEHLGSRLRRSITILVAQQKRQTLESLRPRGQMTLAICLSCGSRRVGAITPCPKCGVESSGYFWLDITFSDHRMSPSNLEHFGEVIRTIIDAADNKEVAHWTLMLHLAEQYPSLLGVRLSPTTACEAAHLLTTLELPTIELELNEPRTESLQPSSMPEPSWPVPLSFAGVGLVIAWIGPQIETYTIPWYQDVRTILVVGFGFLLMGSGVQGISEYLRFATSGRDEAL